jgi:hypothetical protein
MSEDSFLFSEQQRIIQEQYREIIYLKRRVENLTQINTQLEHQLNTYQSLHTPDLGRVNFLDQTNILASTQTISPDQHKRIITCRA